MRKTKLKIMSIILICLTIFIVFGIKSFSGIKTNEEKNPPIVKINLEKNSIIYEGDLISCDISGDPDLLYWQINNQSKHYTFYKNNPVIFDPEPASLTDEHVTLTVTAENSDGIDSDKVQVIVKRIFFGDIHWHTNLGDGKYSIDEMYENTIKDNYLDFAACSEHAESIATVISLTHKPFPIIRNLIERIAKKDTWNMLKKKAIEYYDPGNFTTILGFEWSAYSPFPGGWKWSPNKDEDVSHINFYYRDVYPDARDYSAMEKLNYDCLFKAMAKERDRGHKNIAFPHHSLGKLYWFGIEGIQKHFPFIYTTNWSFLSREMKNTNERDKILRGVETYSRWGNSLGKYSDISITWPYLSDDLKNRLCICDKRDAWVENGMWEWSSNELKGRRFVMQAGSDTHNVDRAGSAELDKEKPSGIIACYATHNTRHEIWDAMNECDIYGSQLLKIRANVRFDEKMALGRWINCSSPLKINISAMSTFPGFDSDKKNMCPHNYSSEELGYNISDILIIKKDSEKGRPYCKVIKHFEPDKEMVFVSFEDNKVKANDFYYILIRQKGEELLEGENEYTAFLGPVFIDRVENN